MTETPKCRRCQIDMVRGKALVNTLDAGMPDFPNQRSTRGQTLTRSGRPKLVAAWKCPHCGHAFAAQEVDA